jgi:hypothetical protein
VTTHNPVSDDESQMPGTVRTRIWAQVLTLAVASLIFAACAAKGFDRGQLKQGLGDEPRAVTDQDIRTALAQQPQLKFPFKLAVELRWGGCYECGGAWREEDKQEIMSWGQRLKESGLVSEMFIVPDVFEKKDLKDIRLAAAQQGADAVLVVRSVNGTDEYLNPASFLYITIVGAWIVPGSDVDALVMLRGAMWDVGNSYLYVAVESEGESHLVKPSMLLDKSEAIDAAKKNALDSFGPEFVRHVEALRGKPS